MIEQLLRFLSSAFVGFIVAAISHVLAAWVTHLGHVVGHVIWIVVH